MCDATDSSPVDGEADRHRALLQLRAQLERLWSRHSVLNADLDEQTDIDAIGRLLLGVLARSGPIRSSDLAGLIGLSRAAVSRRVAALQAQGLVESVRDPEDGRAWLLRLSDQGVAHLERAIDCGVNAVNRLTEDFALDDVRLLGDLLTRMNDNAIRPRAGTKGTTA